MISACGYMARYTWIHNNMHMDTSLLYMHMDTWTLEHGYMATCMWIHGKVQKAYACGYTLYTWLHACGYMATSVYSACAQGCTFVCTDFDLSHFPIRLSITAFRRATLFNKIFYFSRLVKTFLALT
jgi:hypothetical protein